MVVAALVFSLFHFKLSPNISEHWRDVAYGTLGLVAIASFVNWLRAKNNSFFTGIEDFCKTTVNSEDTMRRLENTWEEGFDFKSGRIDKDYIICLLETSSKVISLENVVWVYKNVTRNMKTDATYVHLFVCFDNGKYQSAEFQNEDSVDAILKYISEDCPDIATGREKEIENLYNNKDMEGLKRYARDMQKKDV